MHEIPHMRRSNSFGLPGICSSIAGCALALALIPDDPQPSGALFWPAAALTAGMLVVPLFRIRAGLKTFLQSEHILMIGIVYWLLLDPLQGLHPLDDVSYSDCFWALVAIGLMSVAIWTGTLGRGWSIHGGVLSIIDRQLHINSLLIAAGLSFCFGMFYFAYSSDFDPSVMISGLGAGRFSAPWSRSSVGGSDAFVEHLKYFGYALPSLTVLMAHRAGWINIRTLLMATMSAVVVAFLAQAGGRRIVGVLVGSAILVWLLLQKKVGIKLLVGAAASLIVLLISLEIMLQYRDVGLGTLSGAAEVRLEGLHVDDNLLRLTQIVRLFPSVQDYVDFRPVAHALSLPIPRVIWPGKPSDQGYDLPSLVGMRGLTLSNSIVGELYAMHGLVAVALGGVILGRLATLCNDVLNRGRSDNPLLYGLGIMTLFASLRSMQDLVIMSYAMLGWIAIMLVVSRSRVRASRRA